MWVFTRSTHQDYIPPASVLCRCHCAWSRNLGPNETGNKDIRSLPLCPKRTDKIAGRIEEELRDGPPMHHSWSHGIKHKMADYFGCREKVHRSAGQEGQRTGMTLGI